MSLSTAASVVAALGSALSAVVAAVAAFASRAAAQRANKAAELMAEIEQQRRHHELTPKFSIVGELIDGSPYPGFAMLWVRLADGQLEALDAVAITILNTIEMQSWALPEGVTEDDAERVLWSGWEFDTFVTGGSGRGSVKASSHRQSKPRRLSRSEGKDWYKLLMRRTAPPAWHNWTKEQWQAHWEAVPLRLSLDCRLTGHEPWIVFANVTIEPSGPKPDPVGIATAPG